MAYIGNIPAEAYTNTVKDSFNGNGSTTAFTLSRPTVTNDVRVVVENVIQDPTVAYSVSGTTLTFTSAPPAGTGNIYVVHLGPAVMTAIPPSEIADATTFASSVTVQGAFTSLGIDDNATSTAMTLDTSGNLLVGKSASSGSTQGAQLQAAGNVFATVSNDYPLYLNRLGSNGQIAQFRKDGTQVGSIGIQSGGLTIDGEAGHSGLRFGGSDIAPRDNGADVDAGIQLGNNIYRFTDLYLSGGVYLGGVGSANHLDDYEEGTWTPTINSTAGFTNPSYSIQVGYYTKTGNIVRAYFRLLLNGGTTNANNVVFAGLPFTATNNSSEYPTGTHYINNASDGGLHSKLLVFPNDTVIYLYDQTEVGVATVSGNTVGNALDILGQVIYSTSS